MAESTAIEWTDHTFNPWVGCTKISPACDHCYAEGWAKRAGTPELWTGERRVTSAANWRQPLKWDQQSAAQVAAGGRRLRVFCASLADVFDNQVPEGWRTDLWALTRATPNLDWQLLTKRPQNIARMLPPDWGDGWPHVWFGTTAEDSNHYRQRWTHLVTSPARLRFLSAEPLLGELGDLDLGRVGAPQWVIVGGESGPGARPMHPDWARQIRDQCAAAGVPFLFKQWGEWSPCAIHDLTMEGNLGPAYELDGCAPDGVHKFQHEARFWNPDGSFVHWPHIENDPAPGAPIYGARRIGKKAAGRLLDGVTHDAFPVSPATALEGTANG